MYRKIIKNNFRSSEKWHFRSIDHFSFLLQVKISVIKVKIGPLEKHQELKNFLL